MATPETNLSNRIGKALKKMKEAGEPIHYRKVWGTPATRAGEPDWDIVYYGRAVKLEAKVEGKKASEIQKHTMRKIGKAGGVTGVVRSVDDVLTILEQTRKKALQTGWEECYPVF